MSQGKPPQYTKEQVAAVLETNYGIVTLAAQKLGCSRQTIYEYIKHFPTLKDYLATGREYGLDIAESSLMSQIIKGETSATIFYLKTQGKRRGYIERVENVNYNVPPELMARFVAAIEAAHLDTSEVVNEFIRAIETGATAEVDGGYAGASGAGGRAGEA